MRNNLEWLENELTAAEKYIGTKINRLGITKVYNLFIEQEHTGFTASYCIRFIKSLCKDHDKTIDKMEELRKADETDDMQQLINFDIMDVYTTMCEHNLNDLEKEIAISLIGFKPYAPIYGTDEEWEECLVSGCDESHKTYQNKRYSSIFKDVFDNGLEIALCIGNTLYSDDGGLTNFATGRLGRKEISFPYDANRKTEIVYLYDISTEEDEVCPYILTNPATIAKLKEIMKAKIEV